MFFLFGFGRVRITKVFVQVRSPVNTASTAAIATSAISASGSRVVRCCSIRPGLLIRLTSLLSLFPARRIISYDARDHRNEKQADHNFQHRGIDPDEHEKDDADDDDVHQKARSAALVLPGTL